MFAIFVYFTLVDLHFRFINYIADVYDYLEKFNLLSQKNETSTKVLQSTIYLFFRSARTSCRTFDVSRPPVHPPATIFPEFIDEL